MLPDPKPNASPFNTPDQQPSNLNEQPVAQQQQHIPVTIDKSIRIAFKASNGKYVTTDSNGNILYATKEAVGGTETFEMVCLEDKSIALKAFNGKYVSNPQNGTLPLSAIADSVGSTEQFEVHDWGTDKIVIHASNWKYVSLGQTDATLTAIADQITSADTFDLVFLPAPGTQVTRQPEDAHPTQIKTAISPNDNPESVYTVCFCGTACTRDEGEVTRIESDKNIYCEKTGYIPVRIHKEISGDLRETTSSVTIRGVGENDWATPRNDSEPLKLDGPLKADSELLSYVRSYSGGNQFSKVTQANGWSAPALALHAANLAASSGKQQYNFIGHSRGAVASIMAAWFLYVYGTDEIKKIPVNIFAIDPVPGTGEWYGILTQLSPNVTDYVGIYVWDMCKQLLDRPFNALVPRPNGLMTGKDNSVTLKNSWWPWDKWKYIADDAQLTDPLKTGGFAQPTGYELYACRGRHSTVAGNATSDSNYDPSRVSDTVKPVPELVYKMARAYLTRWGTTFRVESAVPERVLSLRKKISTNHREFDAMGGGETRTSVLPRRPYVRQLSSILGNNPFNTYYMDNVVGDPPYKMAYPVTNERTDAGWVKWKFL